MPSDDARERMMEEACRLSSDDFLRTNEANRRKFSGQFVSIKDLAAERGKSVRTLRRWNNRPDAPQRIKIGRRHRLAIWPSPRSRAWQWARDGRWRSSKRSTARVRIRATAGGTDVQEIGS